MDNKLRKWSRKGNCPFCRVSGGTFHRLDCKLAYTRGKEAIQRVIQYEDVTYLANLLREANNTIYYHVDHVSPSGMTRHIIFYIAPQAGTIMDISYSTAQLLGYSRAKYRGIIVKGAGMDMGYHVAAQLAQELSINFLARQI